MSSHLLALTLVLQVAVALLPVDGRGSSAGQPPDEDLAGERTSKPSGGSRALDFNELALDFQQDNLKTDTLIKVINDTNGVNETTRSKLYNLISEQILSLGSGGWRRRDIVYMDTIFTKRWVRELEGKMNVSYEGESKSDPAIRWEILHNGTTILVVRSASKYYYWTHVQSVASFIILCMIVGGNLSILHRLKSCRRRRSNVNYFIVQLAIADLLVGIFSVTLDSGLRIHKVFRWGLFACQASKYIPALFIYSSTYLLVALSVDRWEAVVKPLAFTRNRSRGHHLVVASWLLAAVSALPVIFFTTIKDIDGLPQCWIHLENYGWRVYMLYLTSLLLILPTLIIAICYTHIVYTIWSKGRLVAGGMKSAAHSSTNNFDQRDKQKGRPFSSSFYVATSPDSMNEELSTSTTRLNQTRASQTSQHSGKFRFSSRRVSWNDARDRHKPLVDCKAVLNERGEQVLTSVGELPMDQNIERGSRLETDQMEARLGELPVGTRTIDSDHKPDGGATSRQQDNEDGDQTETGGARGGAQEESPCRVGAATRQRGEAGVNLAPSATPSEQPAKATTIEPAASQSVGGRRHRSRLTSRMASQGLRMLSFVRSQSRASSFSASPSSSNSSSSSLALRSRPKSVAATSKRLVMRPEGLAAAAADRQDIAINDLGNSQEVGRDGEPVVALGGSARDRSLTGASHVGEEAERGAAAAAADSQQALPGRRLAAAEPGQGALIHTERTSQTNNSSAGNGGQELNPLEGLRRSREGELGASLSDSPAVRPAAAGEQCDSREETRDRVLAPLGGERPVAEEPDGDNLRMDSRRSSAGCDARSQLGRVKEVSVWGVVAAAASKAVAARRDSQQSGANETSGGSRAAPPVGGKRAELDFVAQQHGSGVIPKARIKTIKMTLVIVVAYILCWTPFLVLNLCVVFGTFENRTHFSLALLTLSQSLAHLNSAVNPIIFWLFSSKRGGGGGQPANKTRQVCRPADSSRNKFLAGRSRTINISYGSNKT